MSVARGRDVFWGVLDRRSLDASRLGRGLGRLAGPPITRFFPNDWVFPNQWVFSKNWLPLLVNLFNRQELANG